MSQVAEHPIKYDDKAAPQQPPWEPGSRILRITYDTYWNAHTTIHVTDPNTETPLYTVDARHRKPQMTVRSSSSDTVVSTVDFHSLRCRIDMTLHGQPMPLNSCGFMKTGYRYTSPAFGGATMTWKVRRKLDELDLVLEDDTGIAIARHKCDYRSKQRGGTLELLTACLPSDEVMEETVLVALAITHYKQATRISTGVA